MSTITAYLIVVPTLTFIILLIVILFGINTREQTFAQIFKNGLINLSVTIAMMSAFYLMGILIFNVIAPSLSEAFKIVFN